VAARALHALRRGSYQLGVFSEILGTPPHPVEGRIRLRVQRLELLAAPAQ